MSELRVTGLSAGYGNEAVLSEVDLLVREGSTVAVLGASGSGKTTLLRVIAGFVRPRAGEVSVGGLVMAGAAASVPAERRGVGYVRQEGSLFPHLSVAGNIAFGLPWPRGRHRERVLELLDLVELPVAMADRRPAELSGGQQQRVALARALAPRPKLVLLDEPFSSLDTALRKSTRDATARALTATGATAVLVTHDQGEALSFADEVVILAGGRVRQVGAPHLVYRQPADAEVARFLGDANLLEGTVIASGVVCELGVLPVGGDVADGTVEVLIRPEQIVLGASGAGQQDAVVGAVTYFGHDAVVELRPVSGSETVAPWLARIAGLDLPAVGERVGITVLGPVRVFPRAGAAAALDIVS